MRARLALLLLLAGPALAEDARPLSIILPGSAGSTSDTLMRVLAPAMQARLGQPVAVVNRDGGSGAIGVQQAARAAPDGTTLLFTAAYAFSVLPMIRQDLGYSLASFTPVCRAFVNTMTVVVRPDSPYRSLQDLVTAARAAPGGVSFGHQGVASVPHLAMMELAQAAGLRLQDVPFRGDPAVVVEVMAGRIDAGALVLGSLRGRDLRPLAVFAATRNPALPTAPTALEQGFDVRPASFGGLLAPAGTPAAVIARLDAACAAAAAEPAYLDAARRGFQPDGVYADAAAFGASLKEDVAAKARLLAGIALKPE